MRCGYCYGRLNTAMQCESCGKYSSFPVSTTSPYGTTVLPQNTIPPATDLLALLKRCKEMLQQVSAQKAMIKTIEQYEDYTGGEPNLGTCKTLGKLKIIADNATALLSDIAKAEEGRNGNEVKT